MKIEALHHRIGLAVMPLRSALACGFVLLVSCVIVCAQGVRWDAPLEVVVGESFQVSLVFEDCSPDGRVEAPQVDGLDLRFLGSNRQITMNNGVVSSMLSFTFSARAKREGNIVLPAVLMSTTAGNLAVAELKLIARLAGGPQQTLPGQSAQGMTRLQQLITANIITEILTNTDEVWVGQVFPLTYRLLVSPQQQIQLRGRMNWPGTGWVVEPWTDATQGEAFHLGRQWVSLTQDTFAMTELPGERVLEPATIDVLVTVGRRNTWPFPQAIQEEATLATEPRVLRVKPLPSGAPESFTGAVGHFDVSVNAQPLELSVGEPVTWSVRIRGLGNWPSNFKTPLRNTPQGWRVIGPDVRRESEPGKIFEASVQEDAILIPSAAGEFVLPAVEFSWFDPAEGVYRTYRSDEFRIIVKPGANLFTAPSTSITEIGTEGELTGRPSVVAPDPSVVRVEPELLRAPLVGQSVAFAPLSRSVCWMLVLLPWCVLPIAIFFIGRKRARAEDPAEVKIRARREMLASIHRAQSTEGRADRSAYIQKWRHSAAVCFGVRKAAPLVEDFEKSELFLRLPDSDRTRWVELICGADEFLYGGAPSLPRMWLLHAEECAKRLVIERCGPLEGWQPRYWLARPAAVAMCLLLIVVLSLPLTRLQGNEVDLKDNIPVDQTAQTQKSDEENISDQRSNTRGKDDALSAYNNGDWQRAEQIWRERVAQQPRDWKAHNNIALALAQQGFWGEASAHVLAARLLAPRAQDPAWNAAIIARKLDSLTREQATWMLPRRRVLPGAWLSVFPWQVLLVGASLLLVYSIWRALWLRQFGTKKSSQTFVIICGMLAVAIGLLALISLYQWGYLTESELVIFKQETQVRTLPSDLEKQIARGARPGETAHVASAFLRWLLVKLPTGERGWVLRDSVVPVYRPLTE